MTPELCTTSLVYNGSHDLVAWIDPLGFRTTYVFDPASAASVLAVVQPLGQRTTYSSYISNIGLVTKDTIRPRNGANFYWTVVTYPTKGRTTLTLGENTPGPPSTIINPIGNRTSYVYAPSGSNSLGYLSRATDARGHMTTISYQPVGSGKTAIYPTSIQSPVAQYQYKYNSNNQLAAVIDELGNRSSLVWDSSRQPDCCHRSVHQTDQLCLRFDGAARGRAKRAGPAGDPGLRQPGPAECRHQSARLSNIICV